MSELKLTKERNLCELDSIEFLDIYEERIKSGDIDQSILSYMIDLVYRDKIDLIYYYRDLIKKTFMYLNMFRLLPKYQTKFLCMELFTIHSHTFIIEDEVADRFFPDEKMDEIYKDEFIYGIYSLEGISPEYSVRPKEYSIENIKNRDFIENFIYKYIDRSNKEILRFVDEYYYGYGGKDNEWL